MGGRRTMREMRDQGLDLEVVVTELDRARAEIASVQGELALVPEGMRKLARAKVLREPMARLALVKRFIEGVLEANGWNDEEVAHAGDD